MFDHDGDGLLSKAELRQSFSTSSMITPGSFEGEEYIQQIINEVDLDGDG